MRVALVLISLFISLSSFALETDQFTLPDTELEDVGPLIENWFRIDLLATLSNLSPQATEDQIRVSFFNRVSRCEVGARRYPINFMGGFCFVFFFEHYLRQLGTVSPQVHWNYFPKNSIYSPGASPGLLGSVYQNGVRYQAISSTINFFGTSIGTDKLAHFIKLGRDYNNRYRKLKAKGLSEKEAVTRTIEEMGVKSEAGFLGFDVSGNYANADLASNFAGFWFYRNLFEDIQWNGQHKKAILARNPRTGLWELRATEILRPFFSLHMNEAFNPGTYITGVATTNLFKNIADRCKQWNRIHPEPGFWPLFKIMSHGLKTLNGWDYGWRRAPGLTPELDRFCAP